MSSDDKFIGDFHDDYDDVYCLENPENRDSTDFWLFSASFRFSSSSISLYKICN